MANTTIRKATAKEMKALEDALRGDGDGSIKALALGGPLRSHYVFIKRLLLFSHCFDLHGLCRSLRLRMGFLCNFVSHSLQSQTTTLAVAR